MLECLVEEWVTRHPAILGFDHIEKISESYGRYHTSTLGDCLGYNGEKVVRIEIETDISVMTVINDEGKKQGKQNTDKEPKENAKAKEAKQNTPNNDSR